MTVECPSCGQVVQIPSFPGWCPACNRRITSLAPPLTSKKKPGAAGPAAGGPSSAESTYSSALPPSLQVPEAASVERPLPYVELPPRKPLNVMLWVKIGSAVVALVLAFVIVFVVIGKTRAYFARTAPQPAPPAPTTPAPQPAPAKSIFDEGYVAKSDAPAPEPTQRPVPQPYVPVVNIEPPIVPKRVDDPPNTVTDQALYDAINKGVSYLLNQFDPKGNPLPQQGENVDQVEGRFALMVLALLHAGQATEDRRLNMNGELLPAMIENLKKAEIKDTYSVYSHSLRAMALAVHNRRNDRRVLTADLEFLLKAAMSGAYDYRMPATKEQRELRRFDNSNTQYGNLGVWAAEDAGVGVPNSYWEEVEKHWSDTQLASGAWGYYANSDARITMTAGGITSMFVAGDQLAAARASAAATQPVDKAPFKHSLQRALDWMATGDNSVGWTVPHPGYALYGLERAGLASGFKRFGKHDWFRVLAASVIASQHKEEGYWDGTDGQRVETAFRILFLARGRHPIMMNKLRFDGAWANRPRDVAKLTDFVYETIERPVNWQVVNLGEPWTEWIDAPILYLASHDPVTIDDANLEQLRLYILNGGLLFTHADADSSTFNAFVEELAKRLFPQLEMRDLPREHDVYSMVYRLAGSEKAPPLRGLSSGTRMLMIHSPTDLASAWQNRLPKTSPIPFQLGANLFVYATGKAPLRHRLDTPAVADVPGDVKPLATFQVARVKHAGNWDPEPAAWPRMARWFRKETNVALNVVPTEAAALNRATTPLAHLTATAPWRPSEAELQAFRRFVREGGLLMIDPCGGSPDLALALQRDVAQAAFPDVAPRDVNAKDQFIGGTGAGMDELLKPLMRVYAVQQLGESLPPSLQIMPVGKGWIVISKLDLITGLLGTNTWGILGYDPNYAQPLVKNLILYACNGRSHVPPPPPPPPPQQQQPTGPTATQEAPANAKAAAPVQAPAPKVIEPPPAP